MTDSTSAWVVCGMLTVAGFAIDWYQKRELKQLTATRDALLKVTRKQNEKPAGKPLIVGREYWVKNAQSDWKMLVYLGKNMEGRYTFYNIDDGNGCSIKPVGDRPAEMFERGDVKWVEQQTEQDCPTVEKEG